MTAMSLLLDFEFNFPRYSPDARERARPLDCVRHRQHLVALVEASV
jgi:hypothetical protein